MPALCASGRCSLQRTKRWTTNLCFATFFLAGGVEYSVIFPTMWDYMHLHFDSSEWLYGLSLAAFSISNLFTGPLFGAVFDRTHRTRLLVLFANLFEIGGNFMYFAAQSKYMILGSRFIVGIGAGAGATIFGELARTSSKRERTFVFSIFIAIRQVGLIIGPAFNFVLRLCNFKVGPFLVSRYTSPGAFMMILWIAIEIMFLFLFFELPSIPDSDGEENSRDDANKSVNASAEDGDRVTDQPGSFATTAGYITPTFGPSPIFFSGASSREPASHSEYTGENLRPARRGASADSMLQSTKEDGDERTPLLSASREAAPLSYRSQSSLSNSSTSINSLKDDASLDKVNQASEEASRNRQQKRQPLWHRFLRVPRHYCRLAWGLIMEETVVLLSILFTTVFNQVSIESFVVPMAENLLHWHEKETSIFYSVAGVEIVIVIAVVALLSKKIGDRWQILIGLAVEVVGYTWMLVLVGNATPETPWILWRFIFGGVIIIFGLPFFMVAGAGLYSKFLPMRIQGFGQGVRRSVFSVAAILGPIWAGGGLALSNYYVLFGVPFGLLLLINVMLLLSFNRLKEPHRENTTPSAADTTPA